MERSYHEFFRDLAEAYSERRPQWYKVQAGPRSYLTFSAGIGGVSLGWAFHQGPEFAVELYISTSSKDRNETIFTALRDDQEAIESRLGVTLEWERLPEKKASRIKWAKPIDGNPPELTPDQRTELISWGVDTMPEFQDEFESRIATLDLDRTQSRRIADCTWLLPCGGCSCLVGHEDTGPTTTSTMPPTEGATVDLVVRVSEPSMADAETWVTEQGGEVVDSLDHGLLEVTLPETAVGELCDREYVSSVELADEMI